MSLHRMDRWVERSGTRVTFGNILAGMSGSPYAYDCATEADAVRFAKFCERRDPKNPNMPVAVGEKVAARYNAKPVTL